MIKGLLCRSVLFPKCARNGVFDELALLLLTEIGDNKTRYALSVASRYVLRDQNGAHEYGCRTAERVNQSYEDRTGLPPSPEKQTFYVGFYDLPKNSLKNIQLEFYVLHVRHLVEHGEKAHFQLELTDICAETGVEPTKVQRRNDRNVAMMKVFSMLTGPQTHRCEADAEHAEMLSEFALPVLPAQV